MNEIVYAFALYDLASFLTFVFKEGVSSLKKLGLEEFKLTFSSPKKNKMERRKILVSHRVKERSRRKYLRS